jgi:hypothetical protein
MWRWQAPEMEESDARAADAAFRGARTCMFSRPLYSIRYLALLAHFRPLAAFHPVTRPWQMLLPPFGIRLLLGLVLSLLSLGSIPPGVPTTQLAVTNGVETKVPSDTAGLCADEDSPVLPAFFTCANPLQEVIAVQKPACPHAVQNQIKENLTAIVSTLKQELDNRHSPLTAATQIQWTMNILHQQGYRIYRHDELARYPLFVQRRKE